VRILKRVIDKCLTSPLCGDQKFKESILANALDALKATGSKLRRPERNKLLTLEQD